MKKLMITAATSALLVGMAACSQSSDDIEMGDANYGAPEETETTQMAESETEDRNLMDADPEPLPEGTETVYLADSELSASNLIGAEVLGVDGEKIATVDDLLINASGNVDSVIFRSGDILDIVGTKGALAFDRLDLKMNAEGEPRFTIGMTEDAIQSVAEFEQEGLNDYRLASEMMGTNAELMNADESERIKDIIVKQDGSVSYAVIADPMMMDQPRQLAFDRIKIEQGDGGGGIVIDATAEEIESLPVFMYEAEAEADASNDGAGDTMDEDDSIDMSDSIMDSN